MPMKPRATLLSALLLAALLSPAAQDERRPTVLEWTPEGNILIAGNGLLARFALESGEEELLDNSTYAFVLSPDGSQLAIARPGGVELRSYPAFTFESGLAVPEPTGGQGPAEEREAQERVTVEAVAWSPDGATVAGGTRAGHVLLWEVESGELWADIGVEGLTSRVTRLVFSADSSRLLSVFGDGRAVLWDVENQDVVGRFPAPRGDDGPEVQLAAMTLSPDGRRVLATHRRGDEVEMVMLDDQGEERWRRQGYGIEFTPDGSAVLALAPPFRIAALYRASDATALRTFDPSERVKRLYAVRLNPEGTRLVGVGEDPGGQVLILWDFSSGRILKTRR